MAPAVHNDDIHVFSGECYGGHDNTLITKSLEIPKGNLKPYFTEQTIQC